jgi:hypothetical protein
VTAPIPFNRHFLDLKMGDLEKDIWFHAALATQANYFEVSRSNQEIRLAIDCYVGYVEFFGPGRLNGINRAKTEDSTFRNILMI